MLKFHLILKNENVTSDYIYWINRNQRSQARETIAEFVNYLSISDMDSIRIQLGLLSMFTSQSNEMTRKTEVNS